MPTDDSHVRPARQAINEAIDRATEQLEAAEIYYPETTSAWAQVLAGLEVAIDYDRRIEDLDERVTALERRR